MAEHQPRRIYSAEELHRLRGSCSAPKLSESIEEHVAEDAELVKGECLQILDHHAAKADPAAYKKSSAPPTFISPLFLSTRHSPSIKMQNFTFQHHVPYIEDVLATPTPINRGKYLSQQALTVVASPTEHILRGSRSFAARSFRSRNGGNSMRASSDRTNNENVSMTGNAPGRYQPSISDRSALAEVAPNRCPLPARLRSSPTPSIKRKKVEDLVKAHGSPQHVRVTAGGRIVPSEQSPLCFPRFGYSAIKANGGLVKFAPGHQQGKQPQWTQPMQDGTQQGYIAQDTEGRLCQIVDGMVLPLAEFNGAFHLYVPAPNLSIGAISLGGAGEPLSESTMEEHQRITNSVAPYFVNPAEGPAKLVSLEVEYSHLELSLRELDKHEVIHGRNMSRPAKDHLVQKRRALVIGMDRVRKAIKAIKERTTTTDRPQTPPPGSRSEHTSVSPASTVQHVRQQNFGGPPPASYYAGPPMPGMHDHDGYGHLPYVMPQMGYWMPMPFDGAGWLPPYQPYPNMAAEPLPTAQRDGAYDPPKTDNRPTSPRQSHALSVEEPEPKLVYNAKSLLNPMSPVYKPAVDGHNGSDHSSAVNKAINQRIPTPMSFTGEAGIKHTECVDSVNASSASSIRTLDFFPQNAREHSMRKHEYPVSNDGSSKENTGPHNSTGSEMSAIRHDNEWPPRTLAKTVTSPKAPPGTPVKPSKRESDDKADIGTIDFSDKPRAWIEGYQAGLKRQPVASDRTGDFLDGYCSGLLKSQPRSDSDDFRRPTDMDQMMRRNAVSSAPTTAKDNLKQAVLAPANEVAVLSPAADGLTVAKTDFNLGAWQKEHDHLMSADGQGLSGYPFPDRKSSVPQSKPVKRDSIKPAALNTELANEAFRHDFTFSAPAGSFKLDDTPGIASIVHHKRVVTPLEWRTRNSLANIANMSSSLFASSQVDGHPSPHDDREPMLDNAAEMAGFASDKASRLREASLDGLSSPTSPVLSAKASPPVSPRSSAMKRFRERHISPKVSPVQQSPVKSALIKTPKTSPLKSESPGKRNWKDLWRHRNPDTP